MQEQMLSASAVMAPGSAAATVFPALLHMPNAD